MARPTRFLWLTSAALALLGGLASVSDAQVIVTIPTEIIDSSSITFALVGRVTSLPSPCTGSATVRIGPGDQVTILNLMLTQTGNWQSSLAFPPFGNANCNVSGWSATHAAPNTSNPIPATPESGDALSFSNVAVPVLLTGTASHSSAGLVCTQISNAGAPCNASFNMANLGVVMGNASGRVPRSGVGLAMFTFAVQAFHNTSHTDWGYVTHAASWRASLIATGCTPDFNNSGTVTVQDIFDFLVAWFAADPRADIYGGGVGVQDIFDFLSLWFTGC